MADLHDVEGILRHDVPLDGIRRRLGTIETIRDAAQGWSADEYDYLVRLLVPYTDALLHELARREHGDDYVPYPHPVGS